MAADQQFLDALKGLGQSVQQYGIGQAVNQANQQVRDIKAQMQPGVEQRQALTDLAQDIFMRMQGAGADPQASAMVLQNLMPRQANSIEQAMFSGDPFLQQAAQEMQNEQEMRMARREQDKFQNQLVMTDRLEAGRDKRAEMSADRAAQRAQATPSAAHLKAAGYASQLISANTILAKLGAGNDGTGLVSTAYNSLAPSFAQTDNFRKLKQIKDQFINAIARPESGAAIGQTEMDKYDNMYFPRAGEGPAVVAQKARARALAIQKTLIEAGPAGLQLEAIPGGPSALGTNLINFAEGETPSFKVDPSKYAKKPRR